MHNYTCIYSDYTHNYTSIYTFKWITVSLYNKYKKAILMLFWYLDNIN